VGFGAAAGEGGGEEGGLVEAAGAEAGAVEGDGDQEVRAVDEGRAGTGHKGREGGGVFLAVRVFEGEDESAGGVVIEEGGAGGAPGVRVGEAVGAEAEGAGEGAAGEGQAAGLAERVGDEGERVEAGWAECGVGGDLGAAAGAVRREEEIERGVGDGAQGLG
jgi:hypothetical protein